MKWIIYSYSRVWYFNDFTGWMERMPHLVKW